MHVHTDGTSLVFETTSARRSQDDRISPETVLGGFQEAIWVSLEHNNQIILQRRTDSTSSATTTGTVQDANQATLEQRLVLQRSRALLKRDIRTMLGKFAGRCP